MPPRRCPRLTGCTASGRATPRRDQTTTFPLPGDGQRSTRVSSMFSRSASFPGGTLLRAYVAHCNHDATSGEETFATV